VGCFSQLSISRFGSRFTKKPDFGTLKMEKALFMGRNKNQPPWRSRPSKGHMHVRCGLVLTNYAILKAESSLF
jgi:hypothetical protein